MIERSNRRACIALRLPTMSKQNATTPIARASMAVPGILPEDSVGVGQRAIGDKLALRNQDHAGDREHRITARPAQQRLIAPLVMPS